MDLKGVFWIKKATRNNVKDAKKETETETLTVMLADSNSTNITISGDPHTLDWLEPGQDVNVHIKLKTEQRTLTEKAHPAMGTQQPVKEGVSDEDWDPDVDE